MLMVTWGVMDASSEIAMPLYYTTVCAESVTQRVENGLETLRPAVLNYLIFRQCQILVTPHGVSGKIAGSSPYLCTILFKLANENAKMRLLETTESIGIRHFISCPLVLSRGNLCNLVVFANQPQDYTTLCNCVDQTSQIFFLT